MDLLGPRSVVDVGCGRGAWLRSFQQHGVQKILGFDGDYVKHRDLCIHPKHFRAVDLAARIHTADTFDLAVCLEVAEHLHHTVKALFMTVWCPDSRSVESNCGIPRG